MKEKTFDELIREWLLEELLSVPEKDMVKQLMQQVCEAKIAECSTKVFHFLGNSPESFEICAIIEELPTDRIKTEKSPPKTY